MPMATNVHVGCCGWSYLEEREFSGRIRRKYSSKLQAYGQLFKAVEINSTFYRLPRLPTAQKWRGEADAVDPAFEFTVKAYQGITHLHRFSGDSVSLFNQLKEICRALRVSVLLLQSPASFRPTDACLRAMRSFFKEIEPEDLILVWEPRGKWYDDPGLIAGLCEECGLVHCVDPFRNDALAFGEAKIAYFRLHGFGRPSMYHYDFSGEELRRLHSTLISLPPSLHQSYVFFNNVSCYRNGLEFMELLEG
jgi:uncharacterized protein YecE (DUF72 family)